jgi:hypothetical protein
MFELVVIGTALPPDLRRLTVEAPRALFGTSQAHIGNGARNAAIAIALDRGLLAQDGFCAYGVGRAYAAADLAGGWECCLCGYREEDSHAAASAEWILVGLEPRGVSAPVS